MLIYRCDKCGKEHKVSGIVKNAWKQHGYEQLAVAVPGVTDVCAACFKEIQAAWRKSDKDQREQRQSRFLMMLGFK